MKYYRNQEDQVFGYDETDPKQESLIAAAIAAGWTDITSSWPPAAPAPTAAQLAMAAIMGGLNITCTSASAIDGTYSLLPSAQSAYDSVTTYINTKGTFPRAMTTTTWPDITGGLHVFPSTSVFIEFAATIADFIDAVDDYANGVPGSAIPSNNVTIA